MLTKLSFKNFKAWKDSGELRLAPITVFFGVNSGGKTSIPQLLLMLKQTAESPDRQRALHLGDGRSLVELGSYQDLLYGHELEHHLALSAQWTLETSLKVTDPLSESVFQGDTLRFFCEFETEKLQPAVRSFEYALGAGSKPALRIGLARKRNGEQGAERDAAFALESSGYEFKRQKGRAWPLPGPARFYGFPSEATAYYQNARVTSDLELELERLFARIWYVGPLRDYPKRIYPWSGEVPGHVGAKGTQAIEAILAGGERTFNLKSGGRKKALPVLVAERLQAMRLIDGFRLVPIAENRREYEVLVKTSAGLPEVRLPDVGFGVSQVLPVIVEAFYIPRRSIAIFEQPEIHLHPSAQAELADLFVDAIRAREDGRARDCQFIIESHSEHFLRRLQRRIADPQCDLSEKDVALYFCEVGPEGAVARPLEVDQFGRIGNWPKHFFGDAVGETGQQLRHMVDRMQESEG
jgi:predicted ATPase